MQLIENIQDDTEVKQIVSIIAKENKMNSLSGNNVYYKYQTRSMIHQGDRTII